MNKALFVLSAYTLMMLGATVLMTKKRIMQKDSVSETGMPDGECQRSVLLQHGFGRLRCLHQQRMHMPEALQGFSGSLRPMWYVWCCLFHLQKG
ncbi:hypothetical protein C823_005172 [Eubacterium plexicaudatum ASF492]|uniref:Uncharacterized protein n=1 Tax=Eubacterium plexicaudatum ASF492 TaxID=1235802 RepID=N2B131_9FIRM|nr:hypothetical protein C823_005172 [Eubacterium plexicaudatum ASF492]